MELPVDERPEVARFTAVHDVRIVSDDGSMCQIFEAGQTQSIRRELFTAAIASGLVPEDPLVKRVITPVVIEERSTEEIVSDGLVEACKLLIAKGFKEDFTVVGQPRAASLKKLVDFTFTTKDIERAFIEAMHEVEQDDNESEEHSESLVDTTE
jgi:hypothetical protein